MTLSRLDAALPLPQHPTTIEPRSSRIVWLAVVLAVSALAYPVAAWVGLGPESGPWAFWPVLGALCGILVRRPLHEWRAIGALAVVTQVVSVYLMRGELAGGARIIGAIGNLAQVMLAALVVRRTTKRESPLERPTDLVWFSLLAVTLVPLAFTPFGALGYSLGLGLPYDVVWWPLFIGNSLSILVFAPLFICWRPIDRSAEPWRARGAEILACELVVAILSIFVFSARSSWFGFIALPYWVLLALAWAAMRCGTRWTSVGVAILTSIAAYCSARGLGPFPAAESYSDDLLGLHGYLAFAAFTSMALAALTEQRRRAYATVTLQNNVRDAFLESSTEALMLRDLEGRYVLANSAAGRQYGVTRESLIGRTFREIRPGRSAGLIDNNDRRVLERGEAISFDETHDDGTKARAFRVTRFPVRDHTGVVRYIGVISRDETAERELGDRLYRAQSLELLRHVTTGVVHDLNNLLTVLLSNTQLLADLPDRSSMERELLRDSSESAEEAARLTGRLMAIGRRHAAPEVEVSVDDVIREAEPLLRALVRGNIDLVLDLNAPGARILLDVTSLEQIVLNLVSNARDAIIVNGRIAVATRVVDVENPRQNPTAASRRLRLTVTDDGTGMSEETMAHIFEPFFTTRAECGGTGLGLYSVWMLARHAGGTISATSTPGDATCFVLDLPLQPDRVEESVERIEQLQR